MKSQRITPLFIAILLTLPVHAQTRELPEQKIPVNRGGITSVNQGNVAATSRDETYRTAQSIEAHAKAWGLTLADWERYEAIKRGPRGLWSANLDPLTTLGVEATTDAERARIAEIQVKIEFTRAEKELAYQRAYDAAFLRQYGNVPMVGNTIVEGSGARIALFISTNCAKCDLSVKNLIQQQTPFDLYVLGTNGNDQAILAYAAKVGIGGAAVRDQRITLNHDRGTLASLGGNPLNLPAAYRRNPVTGLWEAGK